MAIEKTVSISWFDRIKQSVGGVVVGFVLVIGMVGLLFWNEGRAVQTEKSLAEGAGLVVSVSPDTLDPANEGRLIHVTGYVTTAEPVVDREFPVSANGLMLRRKVEMYQWVESRSTEKKVELGGSETQVTTYSYAPDWSSQHQNSVDFEDPTDHQNPTMDVASESFSVPSANLGAFVLDQNIIGSIGSSQPYLLSDNLADGVQAAVGAGMRASIVNGTIYLGSTPSQPVIGDYRISYEFTPASQVSIIAAQRGSGLASYKTESGDSLLMVDAGAVAAEDMFEGAAAGNSTFTWLLRAVGIVLLIAGFGSILGPLSVVASVLPFLGSILGFGTGIIAGIFGVALGALTIGTAWLFYRPLTALLIFAVAAIIVGGLIYIGSRKKAAPATRPA
ncbi:TMEM43 family protein [Devosia sp. WQ 349]|uniref:TMEM43 family protein n=1 Tax=Devosia sp. WQ 349K1 TaxID=2800329 RepID=UPI00190493F8|nr:TMEM43 family protein [Devosia sp. WQ 349K1]MBK1793192.1 TMEM43 family protein [Devosia sp. WQ 349K1]